MEKLEAVNKQRVLVEYYGEDYIDGDIPPIESGIYLPEFRLPTEYEGEYAAYGQVGDQWLDEKPNTKTTLPLGRKNNKKFKKLEVLVNFKQIFKRGRRITLVLLVLLMMLDL